MQVIKPDARFAGLMLRRGLTGKLIPLVHQGGLHSCTHVTGKPNN